MTSPTTETPGSSPSGPRFLISRLSHIGDAVLTMPLACELKLRFPGCQVAWAAEGAASKLLHLHPDVDRVIVVPRGWLRQPKAWGRLRQELRDFAPDVSFDPQGLLKSSALARLSGAAVRIGFRGKFGREGSTWLNNHLLEPQSSHLVDRTMELLGALPPRWKGGRATAVAPTVRFGLAACPEALARCGNWLSGAGLRDFLLLNVGAGWPSKQWPAERFGHVAHEAQQAFGIPSLILWAGATERTLAEQAVAASQQAARLAPPTSLPELAALCGLARVFVAGDTGPLHIAAAMGCRCVGLYGPTRPEDSGAYGPGQIAIQKWYQSGTSRQRRSATNAAMCDIKTEDVLQGISAALKQPAIQIPNPRLSGEAA